MSSNFPTTLDSLTLKQLYIEQGLTSRKIGDIYGVSHRTVLNYLGKFDIPRHPAWGKPEVGYWKGKNLTEETKKKISDTRIGLYTEKENPNWRGGKYISCNYCEKPMWRTPCEIKKNKNNFCSTQCKSDWQAENMKGENNPNFIDGTYKNTERKRLGRQYKFWRRECMKRDSWVCQDCGTKKDLTVHHIKPFAQYPEDRFETNNGITLCQNCHSKIDLYFHIKGGNNVQ